MKKELKNLFDANTEVMQIEGHEFKAGQISEDLSARYEKFRTQLQSVEDKASVPCFVTIIKFALNLVWICILGGLLQACAEGTTWKRMYQNASGLFYVGGGAFALWLLLFIYEIAKKNNAYGKADLEAMKHQAKMMEEQLHMELCIPAEAQLVDVIHQCYEIKNGKKKVVHAMLYAFINQEMYVWRKEDRICFCDRTELYEIPVDRFGEAELWKKPLQVSGWNKEEPIDDKKFKEYKPYQTNAGIFVKQHYLLPVIGEAENFVIRIPNYDFATVQNLIHER
ncbi:MAG: hypothetical protein IJ429_02365 [Lachnospiraceae bacterium]|nr:hypothetical protein [Lachnospiraceae bacterium]